MTLQSGFVSKIRSEIATPVRLPLTHGPHPLGPLADLAGTWRGHGFNTIWRPIFGHGKQDRFLELNRTTETIEFTPIPGAISNGSLGQADRTMVGLHYLHQIGDANVGAGLHLEPGVWAVAPTATDSIDPPSVVRMASMPRGTSVLAQGAWFDMARAPLIDDSRIDPFPIGGTPGQGFALPEQDLARDTDFRTQPADLHGITQAMVDNPNSVLKAALAGQTIARTIVLAVSSRATPNGSAARAEATFWIEHVEATPAASAFLQLQYTQTVLLEFGGRVWPHLTVATLSKVLDASAPPRNLGSDAPVHIERDFDQTRRLNGALRIAPARWPTHGKPYALRRLRSFM